MKSLLVGVAVTVIGGLLLFFLTSKTPNVIYTLTDPIPIQLPGDSFKTAVQQLEVKNIGGAVASKISVRLKSPISSYELLKYSESDIPQVFKNDDEFEMVYPELPPDGGFKLIIKSLGVPKALLTIGHSAGSGTDAFYKRGPFDIVGSLLPTGIGLVYIVLIAFVVRLIGIDRWEHIAKYESEQVLKSGRPWYIQTVKWETIRKEAIDSFSGDRLRFVQVDTVEQLTAFKVLASNNKPEYVDKDEWEYLIDKSVEVFLARSSSAAMEVYSSKPLLAFLQLERPILCPDTQWTKLHEKAEKLYVLMRKAELRGRGKIEAELASGKPDGLSEELWSELRAYCENEYILMLSADIQDATSPIECFNSQSLIGIGQDQIDDLHKMAYELSLNRMQNVFDPSQARRFIDAPRPMWMVESDYQRILRVSKKVVDLDRDTTEYEKLVIESRANEAELMALKSKIEWQLEIIDKILSDPSSIETIEDYSNRFAPKNFENLKRLAQLMRKSAQP